ncbi:hypothetical protein H920_05812 [Fukomys damarensis]|uniref:Uncharacterized protein n=1 Tax=Fukomys damarensis TaxID=885580 RepID=A0A091DRA6_FUKDA|nr:hypothetical protein H920_05812 [Fukomys damarensis]
MEVLDGKERLQEEMPEGFSRSMLSPISEYIGKSMILLTVLTDHKDLNRKKKKRSSMRIQRLRRIQGSCWWQLNGRWKNQKGEDKAADPVRRKAKSRPESSRLLRWSMIITCVHGFAHIPCDLFLPFVSRHRAVPGGFGAVVLWIVTLGSQIALHIALCNRDHPGANLLARGFTERPLLRLQTPSPL